MGATTTDTDPRQVGRQSTYEGIYTLREEQRAQGISLSHRAVDGDFIRRMTINMNGRYRIQVHTSYVLLEKHPETLFFKLLNR
jgi:hypothetical protein